MKDHRETFIRVHGAERIIRTELGGTVKTVRQLETAHTKAVKAALVEMRKTGGFPTHGTYNVATARKPFPPVKFTDRPASTTLIEVAPGEWVSDELLVTERVAAASLTAGNRWVTYTVKRGRLAPTVWEFVGRDGDTVTARNTGTGELKSQADPEGKARVTRIIAPGA